MKVLLVALALIAVIRPEHLTPVVLAVAAIVGLLFLAGQALKTFKGGGHSALASSPLDTNHETSPH
jgi:hypothetical protein